MRLLRNSMQIMKAATSKKFSILLFNVNHVYTAFNSKQELNIPRRGAEFAEHIVLA